MSITLTTTPLSTEDILIEWSYSTFDQETIVQKSTDGINWGIVLSPLPAGTNSVVASGLTEATKYYFRIKKTVWVGYTKANGDSDTLLDFKTALAFDGVNDSILVSGLSAVPFVGTHSGVMWFKVDTEWEGAKKSILTYYDGTGNDSLWQLMHKDVTNGEIEIACNVITKSGTTLLFTSGRTPYVLGSWAQLTYTFLPSALPDQWDFTFWINGVLIDDFTFTFSAGNVLQDNYGQAYICAAGNGTGSIEITLDQLVIINNTDVTLDVASIYNSGKGTDVFLSLIHI